MDHPPGCFSVYRSPRAPTRWLSWLAKTRPHSRFSAPMIVVGVDENGLGPRLGPLIATAVALDVQDYDATRLRRVGARIGVGDSKTTSAFGAMAHAEGL